MLRELKTTLHTYPALEKWLHVHSRAIQGYLSQPTVHMFAQTAEISVSGFPSTQQGSTLVGQVMFTPNLIIQPCNWSGNPSVPEHTQTHRRSSRRFEVATARLEVFKIELLLTT